MWDLVPWPRIKPGPPALGAQSLTTGPPGKSLHSSGFCSVGSALWPLYPDAITFVPLLTPSWLSQAPIFPKLQAKPHLVSDLAGWPRSWSDPLSFWLHLQATTFSLSSPLTAQALEVQRLGGFQRFFFFLLGNEIDNTNSVCFTDTLEVALDEVGVRRVPLPLWILGCGRALLLFVFSFNG